MMSTASETMESVRFMINKHLKGIDFSVVGTKATQEKDRTNNYINPLTLKCLLGMEFDVRSGTGLTPEQVALKWGYSVTMVYNIRNRKRRFATMPRGSNKDIAEWFKDN